MIEFKGTAGEWKVTTDEEFSDAFYIKPTPTFKEAEANAKLMASSKKMMEVLIKLIDQFEKVDKLYNKDKEIINEAKQVLKEAL